MNDAMFGELIVGIVLFAIVVLVLRELFCWYWKINKLIKIQQTTLETMLKMFEKSGGAVNWDAVKDIIGR